MLSHLRPRIGLHNLLAHIQPHQTRVYSSDARDCPRQPGKGDSSDSGGRSSEEGQPSHIFVGDGSGHDMPKGEMPQQYVRDLVNFPRPVQLERSPPTKFGFIPKSYFDFFYKKTGVTGPYMFMASVGTYLLSKEIYVLNAEFSTALSYILILWCVNQFFPQIKVYRDKIIDECIREINESQQSDKDEVKEYTESLDKMKLQTNLIPLLSDVKRENVYLQMEEEYRKRLSNVHATVKKQLDYFMENSAIEGRYNGMNLMYWMQEEVEKSLTPAFSEDVMKQSISNLKNLAEST